ncbi:hypothetical protein cand_033430, partial [Cryptosporidium andersoni]
MRLLYLVFLLIIPIVTNSHQDVLFMHEDVVDHNHMDNLLGNIQNHYQDIQHEHQYDHNLYDISNTHAQMGLNALQAVKLHNQFENNNYNRHGTGEHYSTNPDMNAIQNKKWQTGKVNFIFGPDLPQPPPLTTHEPMITGVTSSEHHDTTIPSHSLGTTIHTDLHTTNKINHQEETTINQRGHKYTTISKSNKPDNEHTTFTTEAVTKPTTHHTEVSTSPKAHTTEVTTRSITHSTETTKLTTRYTETTTKPTTIHTETTTKPTTHS